MKNKKSAIIFGVSGQDGAYLAHFLLTKGYEVIGTTRSKSVRNLYRLKNHQQLELIFFAFYEEDLENHKH